MRVQVFEIEAIQICCVLFVLYRYPHTHTQHTVFIFFFASFSSLLLENNYIECIHNSVIVWMVVYFSFLFLFSIFAFFLLCSLYMLSTCSWTVVYSWLVFNCHYTIGCSFCCYTFFSSFYFGFRFSKQRKTARRESTIWNSRNVQIEQRPRVHQK